MAFVTFPEPPDLAVPYEQMITDGKPKSFGYSVENPHPGYGKDPNILNELGHTKFPMFVYSNIKNERIIVENEMELAQHTAEIKPSVPQTTQQPTTVVNNGWPVPK